MENELDLSKYSIRTDLAIEAQEIAIEHKGVACEKMIFRKLKESLLKKKKSMI